MVKPGTSYRLPPLSPSIKLEYSSWSVALYPPPCWERSSFGFVLWLAWFGASVAACWLCCARRTRWSGEGDRAGLEGRAGHEQGSPIQVGMGKSKHYRNRARFVSWPKCLESVYQRRVLEKIHPRKCPCFRGRMVRFSQRVVIMKNHYLFSSGNILSIHSNHAYGPSAQKLSSNCILSEILKKYQTGNQVFLYILARLRYNTILY